MRCRTALYQDFERIESGGRARVEKASTFWPRRAFSDDYSLFPRKKFPDPANYFPVPLRREFIRNLLNYKQFFTQARGKMAQN